MAKRSEAADRARCSHSVPFIVLIDQALGIKCTYRGYGKTLRRLALDGHGLFLAPSFLVADDLRTGRLVRILEDHVSVEFAINAIYPYRHHLSTKVRSFIDLLAERFAEHRRSEEHTSALQSLM